MTERQMSENCWDWFEELLKELTRQQEDFSGWSRMIDKKWVQLIDFFQWFIKNYKGSGYIPMEKGQLVFQYLADHDAVLFEYNRQLINHDDAALPTLKEIYRVRGRTPELQGNYWSNKISILKKKITLFEAEKRGADMFLNPGLEYFKRLLVDQSSKF